MRVYSFIMFNSKLATSAATTNRRRKKIAWGFFGKFFNPV